MAAWPDSLPGPTKTISVTAGSNVSRQQWQSGRAEMRRFGAGAPDKIKVQIRLRYTQVPTFNYWYNRSLSLGVNWFTADWLTGMGYASHMARIIGFPKLKGKSSVYSDYSATLLIQQAAYCPIDKPWPVPKTSLMPDPSFNYSIYDGTFTVKFNYTGSGGTPYTFTWYFGDGTTSSSSNPTHTYDFAGDYTVTLTVENNVGDATVSQNITVSATLPAPHFTATNIIGSGTVVFDYTGVDGAAIDYAWSFGDGETSTDQSPLHTYDSAGEYTVVLTVTNAEGSAAISLTISVASVDDDFTGVDGETPNDTLWTLDGSQRTLYLKDNKLRGYIEGSSIDYQNTESKYLLSSDLEVQTDYALITQNTTSDFIRKSVLIFASEDESSYTTLYREYDGLERYSYNQSINNVWGSATHVSTADSTGKLRLLRSGSTITAQYWNGSGWTTLAERIWVSDRIKVLLVVRTQAVSASYVADFDNFKANFGTIVWKSD